MTLWTKDLRAGGAMELPTIFGGKIKTSVRDGELYINDALVIGEDIVTTHGVMHIVDRMLDPRREPGYKDHKDPKAVRCKCVHKFCKDDKTACSISRGNEQLSGTAREFEPSVRGVAGMILQLAAAAVWFWA